MQIQFNTGVCTLMLFKVPEGTTMVEVDKVDNLLMCWPDSSDMADYFDLPDGKWQFIGLSHELTEEQCKAFIKHELIGGIAGVGGEWLYPDYEHSGFGFETAKESFASLCRYLKIYNVNPFIKPADDDYSFYTDINVSVQEEWQEAQERTSKNWAVLRLENE